MEEKKKKSRAGMYVLIGLGVVAVAGHQYVAGGIGQSMWVLALDVVERQMSEDGAEAEERRTRTTFVHHRFAKKTENAGSIVQWIGAETEGITLS